MQSPWTVSNCHLWPVWLYRIFPHLVNGEIFGKKSSPGIKCFFFPLQLLAETHLIRARISWDIIINTRRSSYKDQPVVLDINQTWIFATDFRKRKSSTIKIYEHLELSCFHAFGLPNMKLIVHSRNSRTYLRGDNQLTCLEIPTEPHHFQ